MTTLTIEQARAIVDFVEEVVDARLADHLELTHDEDQSSDAGLNGPMKKARLTQRLVRALCDAVFCPECEALIVEGEGRRGDDGVEYHKRCLR